MPPGGAGEIKATFKSKGYVGSVKKAVTVETNDPRQRTVRLTLKGKVIADVIVAPRYVNFGNVQRDQLPRPTELTVQFREGSKVRVKEVRSENPAVVVTPGKPKDDAVVYAVALTDQVPVGRLAGQIVIETTSKKHDKVVVPVHAFVQGSVKVSPQLLSLGVVHPGKPVTRMLTLSKTGGEPFSVEKVEPSSDRVRCKLITEKEGERYRVEVIYDPGDRKQGRVSDRLTIVTRNGEEESIQVPVYGIVRETAATPGNP